MVNAWWDKSPLDEAITSLEALNTHGAEIFARHLYLIRAALLLFWKLSRQSFELIKKQSKEWGNDVGDVHPYLVDEELYQVFVSYLSLITLISRGLNLIERKFDSKDTAVLMQTNLMKKRHRIGFYRNKLEHWDDYAQIIPHAEAWPNMKLVFITAGGPNDPEAEKRNHNILVKLFEKYRPSGNFLNLPALAVTGSFVEASYVDWIYSNLELIDPQLTRKAISDEIIRQLFFIGFPLPIIDFQSCLSEFSTVVKRTAQEFAFAE